MSKTRKKNNSMEETKFISKERSNSKNKKVKTEDTTRIRIDRERINDSDSLDTSFLEGRIQQRTKNNPVAKAKILEEKKDYSIFFRILKSIFLIIFCLGIVCLAVFGLKKLVMVEEKPIEEEVVEKPVTIDDNYLFVGDFYTTNFDFNEFQLDYHYVKVCEDDLKIKDILEDENHYVYRYNPSIVFLQLGINDLMEEEEKDRILDSYVEVILGIQENRPYAKIYVQSLYPINPDVEDFSEDQLEDISTEDISLFNSKLQSKAKELNVQYLDVYHELSEEDRLKEEYTDDGITLNKEGYEQVLKIIRKIVDDKSEN